MTQSLHKKAIAGVDNEEVSNTECVITPRLQFAWAIDYFSTCSYTPKDVVYISWVLKYCEKEYYNSTGASFHLNKVKQWVESQNSQDEVKALKELIQEWETGGIEDVEE